MQYHNRTETALYRTAAVTCFKNGSRCGYGEIRARARRPARYGRKIDMFTVTEKQQLTVEDDEQEDEVDDEGDQGDEQASIGQADTGEHAYKREPMF